MVQAKQIGVLLLAASLAGCGSYSMFDTSSFMSSGYTSGKSDLRNTAAGSSSDSVAADSTGSTAQAPSQQKSDNEALTSLFARAAQNKAQGAQPQDAQPQDAQPQDAQPQDAQPKDAQPQAQSPRPALSSVAKPVVVADARDIPVSAAPAPAVTNVKLEPRGRAYLFRGIAGLIYSRGMDKLAERIRRAGIPASVDTYLVWRPIADQAIRDYRRDPQPIILIGHSMGGDACLAFAEMLNAADIPVKLLVTYDPSRLAEDVPPNVERYINIFQSSNMMGGGNVVQGSRFHGHYASYNLKDHREIIHINIEKADQIQQQLVSKVVELASTPATAEGEAVPIRLEVPAGEPVELWDSGQPLTAHAGDTLKTFADTYHVPLWSLAEINPTATRGPLAEGQRIIVPRHLVPMGPDVASNTISSYAAPAGR